MNTVIVSCPSCGKKNRIPADRQHLGPKCGHCKRTISMNHQAVPVELGDRDFHDFVKQAPLPVLVDFFSPTCGPCRMMAPVIDEIARENVNKYIVAKVDTSKNQSLALFFNIRAVPTVMFFKDGALVDQISGAVSKTVLEQKLKSL